MNGTHGDGGEISLSSCEAAEWPSKSRKSNPPSTPSLSGRGVSRAALVAVLLAALSLCARAAAQEPSTEELAWLKAHVIEVKSVNAGTGFDDLRPLKDLIGPARIVALEAALAEAKDAACAECNAHTLDGEQATRWNDLAVRWQDALAGDATKGSAE